MTGLFPSAACVEAVFGLGLLLLPADLLALVGIAPEPGAVALARLFGSALLAFAVLLWLAHRSSQAEMRRTTAFVLLVYYLLSGVVFLLMQLDGVMNPLGWGSVALHAGFTLWCAAYLRLSRTRAG